MRGSMSTGRGQRCSVGNSQRYQPSLNAVEQRAAQDYTFEALHRRGEHSRVLGPQGPT